MTEEQAPAGDDQAHRVVWDDVQVGSREPGSDELAADPAGAAPSFFGDDEGGIPDGAGLLPGTDDGGWQPAAVPTYEPYYGAPAEDWSTDRFESIMRDTIDAQAQEQKQLEELLRDVRTALTALPAPEALAETSAAQAALGAQVERLAADLAAARSEQAELIAALSARVEELSAPAPEAGTLTLQDLHDGLAGVRTDVSSLPDQIGPAVTSAVAHGIAGTASQVGLVQEALADLPAVVAETAELRVLVAEQAEHVALLPQAVDGLRDLTERVAGLEAAVDSDPAPAPPSGAEIAAAVDESVARRLEEHGTGLTQQLDALGQRVEALHAEVADIADAAAAPTGAVALDPTALDLDGRFAALDLDGRFAALHDELREMRLAAEGPTAATAAVEDRIVAVQDDLRAMRLATEGPASPDAGLVALLHASEQRLAHHIDEAVLALAQAVLRRRVVVPASYAGSSPLVPGSDGAGAASTAQPDPPLTEPAESALRVEPAEPAKTTEPAEPAEPLTDRPPLHDDLTDATAAEEPASVEVSVRDRGEPIVVDEPVDEDGDRLGGVLEAWAKGEPAPQGEAATGWPEPPLWPTADDGSSYDDDPEAAEQDGRSEVALPSRDVLPGRHRPGTGDKRGLFRRRG